MTVVRATFKIYILKLTDLSCVRNKYSFNILLQSLIGLRAFDLVSSRVWWEAATNTNILLQKNKTNYKI